MVTKVEETADRVVERERLLDIAPVRPRGGRGPRGGGGGPNGGGPGGGGGGGDRDSDHDWSPEKFRLAVYVGIVSILMMFGSLGLAYVLRMSVPEAGSRYRFFLPELLWLSTVLIVASSLTFIAANHSLRRGAARDYLGWLAATLCLGLFFIISQGLSWRQLAAQGLLLATNPHSTFFYVLTALHALHVLGGVVAILLLLNHARRVSHARGGGGARTRAYTDAVGVYWHFMGLLWMGVFALLIFEA